MMKRNEALIYSAVGLAALFLLLVAFNYLASGAAVRADLTEGNLYTLSDGTRKMLRGLKAPVKLKLYISQGEQAMPVQLRSFAQRVDDMAREFKSVAGPVKGLNELGNRVGNHVLLVEAGHDERHFGPNRHDGTPTGARRPASCRRRSRANIDRVNLPRPEGCSPNIPSFESMSARRSASTSARTVSGRSKR